MSAQSDRESINLPVRPFLYTLDQVASLLNVTETRVITGGYIFFAARTPGVKSKDEMLAVNIAPKSTDPPEWRIEERELIRWFKRKGFRVID